MRLYGLIGFPLGHSFSQRYFTEKFEKEAIADCAYRNFPIRSIEEVESLLRNESELQGFNVTIPYKQQIVPYLSSLSGEAREIGAVNCVRITPGGLAGYNTDAYGFRNALLELLSGAKPGQALVLGTGGASKAVKYVLRELEIPFGSVSRDGRNGDYTYETLTAEAVASHRLIVNATPLGTHPATEGCPQIPFEGVGPDHFLFDLVYNPPLTEFLRRGAARGAATLNGYGMLVGQAERAWEIWNSRDK